jgi:hypothetical protein
MDTVNFLETNLRATSGAIVVPFASRLHLRLSQFLAAFLKRSFEASAFGCGRVVVLDLLEEQKSLCGKTLVRICSCRIVMQIFEVKGFAKYRSHAEWRAVGMEQNDCW